MGFPIPYLGGQNFQKIFDFSTTQKTPKWRQKPGRVTWKFLKLDFSTFFQLQNSFHVKTTCLGPFPAKFKIFHFFTIKTPKCLSLGEKFSKIFKTRIFDFFQLQNSFHVKTTCLGPFPAKFKFFHFFTKKTPKCLGLRGKNFRKFLKLEFSTFFNFRTRFMSKQHVWDHFQQNLKFFIFSPKNA